MLNHFNYWLTGSGWAEAFFSNDKVNVRFECSYLSDPLAELFEGLTKLSVGEVDRVEVSFMEEPGRNHVIISRRNGDEIGVLICWDDSWDRPIIPDSNTPSQNILYADTDTLTNFSRVVCQGIDDLLNRHTLEEYKMEWDAFEFPLDKYHLLKNTLS